MDPVYRHRLVECRSRCTQILCCKLVAAQLEQLIDLSVVLLAMHKYRHLGLVFALDAVFKQTVAQPSCTCLSLLNVAAPNCCLKLL